MVMKSARVPLVIQHLAPLITYSLPTLRAVVRIAATSEPQLGSLTPSAAILSPLSAGTRNSSFCSRVPISLMMGVAIVDCTARPMLTPAQLERTSSSPHTAVYHQSPPEPPTSSGYEAPRKPISPAFLNTSRGNSSAFSHSLP